jgi:uncharacterized Zn-binding protein involved in type VI secretion
MPAVARLGDSVLSPDGSGFKCRMPLKTSVGEANSKNVYANGILITVQGNKVAPHPKSGCTPDTSGLDSGSSQVFVDNKGMGRIGDSMGDNVITQGSSTVFAS